MKWREKHIQLKRKTKSTDAHIDELSSAFSEDIYGVIAGRLYIQVNSRVGSVGRMVREIHELMEDQIEVG